MAVCSPPRYVQRSVRRLLPLFTVLILRSGTTGTTSVPVLLAASAHTNTSLGAKRGFRFELDYLAMSLLIPRLPSEPWRPSRPRLPATAYGSARPIEEEHPHVGPSALVSIALFQCDFAKVTQNKAVLPIWIASDKLSASGRCLSKTCLVLPGCMKVRGR